MVPMRFVLVRGHLVHSKTIQPTQRWRWSHTSRGSMRTQRRSTMAETAKGIWCNAPAVFPKDWLMSRPFWDIWYMKWYMMRYKGTQSSHVQTLRLNKTGRHELLQGTRSTMPKGPHQGALLEDQVLYASLRYQQLLPLESQTVTTMGRNRPKASWTMVAWLHGHDSDQARSLWNCWLLFWVYVRQLQLYRMLVHAWSPKTDFTLSNTCLKLMPLPPRDTTRLQLLPTKQGSSGRYLPVAVDDDG